MATVQTNPRVSSPPLSAITRRRRFEKLLRALQDSDWEDRIRPLATHMAAQRLVRAPSYTGAYERHLDPQMLREALGRLLGQDEDQGTLVYRLLIEGTDPAIFAAQRGISRPDLLEMLREAVRALAVQYEHAAYASVGATTQERMLALLAGKRG